MRVCGAFRRRQRVLRHGRAAAGGRRGARARPRLPPRGRRRRRAFRTHEPRLAQRLDGLGERAAGGDDVLDQAHAARPARTAPSTPVRGAVLLRLARTIRNGSPDASDAAAASATAPSAGPASRTASGSNSRDGGGEPLAERRRAAPAASRSGTCRGSSCERRPERRTKSPSSSACSRSSRAELVAHAQQRACARASSSRSAPARRRLERDHRAVVVVEVDALAAAAAAPRR